MRVLKLYLRLHLEHPVRTEHADENVDTRVVLIRHGPHDRCVAAAFETTTHENAARLTWVRSANQNTACEKSQHHPDIFHLGSGMSWAWPVITQAKCDDHAGHPIGSARVYACRVYHLCTRAQRDTRTMPVRQPAKAWSAQTRPC